MKMRVFCLSLLLILLLKIDQISNKNVRDSKADNIPHTINALGQKVTQPVVLTTFPMTVKSCDNIAIFKAKYITDLNEYKDKNDGWYSVSAYTINLYADKDANKLIHSVEIANLKHHPSLLKGAKGCVIVEGGALSADITICFKDKGLADNLIQVIKTFYQCRMGDNLQPIPPELLKQLFQMCGNNGPIKWNKDNTPLAKQTTPIRADNKWDADRLRYYHPAGIHVPGTI